MPPEFASGAVPSAEKSTNVSSEPWTCTTFDDAGRVDTIDYPAWNSQPARTVSHDYMVGGDPRVTSVTDPAGTITNTADWAGRATSTEDVWGFTTTVAYDNHGRVVTASNPAGVTGYTYDGEDRVTQQTLDGDVVAVPSYDTLGRMTGVKDMVNGLEVRADEYSDRKRPAATDGR